MIAYTVTCTFLSAQLADEWIAWLKKEHMAEVIALGAIDAEVVKLDGNPVRCEARYHFASRESFNDYEREHAGRLRQVGLKRFPLERGLSYVRGVGEVVATSDKPKPRAATKKTSRKPATKKKTTRKSSGKKKTVA